MAANSRANTGGIAYSENEIVPFGEFNTVDTNAAQSVNRNSTTSGWCAQPIILLGGTAIEIDVAHSTGQLVTTGNTGFGHAFALTSLPNGHILDGIRLYIVPANAGRGAGAPGNMPAMKVWRRTTTLSMTVTQLGATQTATWVDEATYEGGQVLEVTGLAATIDNNTHDYFITFVTEYGANSFAGLTIAGLAAYVTIDASYNGADLCFWRK